jgi:hypothetical protein
VIARELPGASGGPGIALRGVKTTVGIDLTEG